MENQPKQVDWPYELYVRNAKLYFPLLESMKDQARTQVDNLCKVLEEYEVPKGSRILDLFCGIGRHSVNLAKKGYQVVGYDPSPHFLGEAAKWAKQESLSSRILRFYQGRAKEASSRLLEKGEGPFRVILLLGTTLGYFQVEQDIQTLREIGSLARHNCLLITETENRDWRIRNFQPYVDYKFKEVFIHESWSMSLETSIAEGKSYYYEVLDQGKSLCLALELAVKMRLYSLHELVAMLERAGWNFLRSYDGLRSLDHATVESPDLLTLSKKVA